jgi:hypothetical protein
VKLTNYTNGALATDATGQLYTFSTSTWRFASSTLLSDSNIFSGLNLFLASTTIGNGTQGLTISGNSTTTGNAYFAGNLGLGTTSPYAKLSVVGEAVAANFTATSTAATSTFAGGLNVGNGALQYDYSSGLTSIQNLALGAMSFDTDAGQVSWVDLPISSNAATGTVNSYTAQIGGTPLLTIYSEAAGYTGRHRHHHSGVHLCSRGQFDSRQRRDRRVLHRHHLDRLDLPVRLHYRPYRIRHRLDH